MEIQEKDLKKLYYSIGEVAEMFHVNTSLIRFWEKEFSIFQPKKNKKGNRLFTVKDIKNFNKIYHLVKVKGFTLDGAKNFIKSKEEIQLNENQAPDQNNIVSKLEEIIEKLKTLKKNN
ncbi:MAG: MerR family transcriptional regulator [Flavobacteriia bacterium]|nr:MerR family transcriptional regulator [Flavobacteriia bacterium]